VTDAWVFVADGATLPSGIFTNRNAAINIIQKYKLSGLLTKYPIDMLVYEWCINNYYFAPKSNHQTSSKFIGRFTSASLEHYHFEDGIELGFDAGAEEETGGGI
jgi:hypothetical protein